MIELIFVEDMNRAVIVELFFNNVKNKSITNVKNHCGGEGHWLEKQFGIKSNCKNEPDILGYELKKYSKKITFGDFSASEYLFSKNKPKLQGFNNWNENYLFSKEEFLRFFGNKNKKKHNRLSWSGSCIPSYGEYNTRGQIMYFNNNLDLLIEYSYKKDISPYENIPEILKRDTVICFWKKEKLSSCINRKFNNNGFFICKKNNNGFYNKICFGKKFDYSVFVDGIKNKNIIFDSGMYNGNTRNYSQFRSGFNFFEKMIYEEY